MNNRISVQQVAKRLGISIDDVKKLIKQGILHPKKQEGGNYYFLAEDIAEIRSRRDLTLSEEAAQVGIQIQREVVASVSTLQKLRRRVSIFSLLTVSLLTSSAIIIAILFNIFPMETSDFFGYYYRFNVVGQAQAYSINAEQPSVLAATTGAEEVAVKTSVAADVLKPIAATSLVIVKAVDNVKYQQIVTKPTPGPGPPGPSGADGADGPPGLTGPQGPAGADVISTSSDYVEVDTLSSVTARGATTTTGVTFSGGLNASTINDLTLSATSDGLTIAGGDTSQTLTLTGADITLGSIIRPSSAGALALQSNGANTLTLDAGGASSVNIGTTNATALTIGKSAVTTTISGIADINNLKIGSGTTILKHLSATTTFDADTIDKNTCGNVATITVTGANIGDTVIATPTPTDGGVETLIASWNAYVSSADTVTIRICAMKEDGDPPSQTWRVDVWQH